MQRQQVVAEALDKGSLWARYSLPGTRKAEVVHSLILSIAFMYL